MLRGLLPISSRQVSEMPRAVLVSGGAMSDYEYYNGILRDDDYIVCADGGIRHVLAMDRIPDLWIGDFDSCRFSDLIESHAELSKVRTQRLNPEKDVTDTHSCIDTLAEMGYREIVMLGSLGGRADHMLSNIHMLEYLYDKGIDALIEDEKNIIRIASENLTLTKRKKYLSIIPLDRTVHILMGTGLKYPIEDFVLSRGISMGVSNEIISDKAFLSFGEGRALVIESDD